MRKVSTLLVAMLLSVIIIQPKTISAYSEENGGVAPAVSYYLCATCGTSVAVASNTYEYTEWATQSTVSCQHGFNYGNDVTQYRYRYDIVKLQCGHSFRTETKTTQTRTVCDGFD